jgi:radical SAM protein with 4Fe4S-binding SPASM domain
MHWGLVSNGYNLDKQMLGLCIDNGIGSITVSLDGQKAAHEWLRGKQDTFNRTMMALDLIAASQIPLIDVVTCVNPHNLSELDSIASILMNTGIPAWRLFRIFPAGRAKNNSDLQLTVAQTRQLIDWVQEKKPFLAKKKLDVQLSCEGWLPIAIDRQVRNQPFFCRAGINIASILSDGTITGCSNNAPRFFEGNILSDSFSYVWQHRFTSFRDRSWVKNTECGTCQQSGHCEGGSIHLWRENDKRPEFCYADCFK